jgi:hypothetical protein
MLRNHLRTIVLTGATAIAAAAPVADALASDPTADQAASYSFVGRPVLLYGHSSYDLIWRLNRDVPRGSNHRAHAQAFLNGTSSMAVLGGGRHQRCFETRWELPSDPIGPPHFGALYKVELRIPGATPLTARIRLKRHTKGYSSFDGNAVRDPKVRTLCGGAR